MVGAAQTVRHPAAGAEVDSQPAPTFAMCNMQQTLNLFGLGGAFKPVQNDKNRPAYGCRHVVYVNKVTIRGFPAFSLCRHSENGP